MRAPLSWIRDFTPADAPVADVVSALNQLGLEVEGVEQPAEQVEVEPAHQARVLAGERVEGAVGQRQLGAVRVRLVATGLERDLHPCSAVTGEVPDQVRPELAAGRTRAAGEALGQRGPGLQGPVGGGGKHPPDHLVVPRRQAEAHLALGAPVQLRGSAGPGPGAPGQPLVLDLEQPFVDQPVEVEAGRVHRQVAAGRRLLAADRLAGGGDVPVEGAPGRVGEGADARRDRGEVLAGAVGCGHRYSCVDGRS